MTTARFPQIDPLFGGADDPQNWNPYIYVLNSPVGSSDPTGMWLKNELGSGLYSDGEDYEKDYGPIDNIVDASLADDSGLWIHNPGSAASTSTRVIGQNGGSASAAIPAPGDPNFIGPVLPNSPNNQGAWITGLKWITGIDSSRQQFGPENEMTQDLMTDTGVLEANEAYIKAGESRENPFVRGYSFGVMDYAREFFTSSTGSFLGSYRVSISNNGNGTVDYTVTNLTGLESGTRSAIPGSQKNPSIQDMFQGRGLTFNPKSILNNRSCAGCIAGNQLQVFRWTGAEPRATSPAP